MKKISELTVEDLKHRLKTQHGFQDDELNVLFPTEDSLRTFYRETLKTRETPKIKSKAQPAWATDSFDLPPQEAADLAALDRGHHFQKTLELGQSTGITPEEAEAAARAASAAIKEHEAEPPKPAKKGGLLNKAKSQKKKTS